MPTSTRAGQGGGRASGARTAPPIDRLERRHPETRGSGIVDARRAVGITVERVLIEYARIAFTDIRQVLTWGPEDLALKSPDQLSDAEAAAIREIAPGARPGAYRVKSYDKKAALDAIARHLGIFPAAP